MSSRLVVALLCVSFAGPAAVLAEEKKDAPKKDPDVKALERLIRALELSLAVEKETNELLRKQLKALRENELKDKKALLEQLEKLRSAEVKAVEEALRADENAAQVKAADLQRKLTTELLETLKKRQDDLLKTIDKRETLILELSKDLRKAVKDNLNNQERAERLQLKVEVQATQIRALEAKLREILKEEKPAENPQKGPMAPNPPAKPIRGEVAKVHEKDRTLVEIKVGAGQGLEKDHTLEVFRLNPRPEYVGMLRIVEVHENRASGRLQRPGFTKLAEIKVGDQVVSSLELARPPKELKDEKPAENPKNGPIFSNPPAKKIRGEVTKVHDADKTLVEINVGAEQGLEKDHTLEVLRLKPQREYVGMLRILDVQANRAVGPLVRSPSGKSREVRVGDQVASDLDQVK